MSVVGGSIRVILCGGKRAFFSKGYSVKGLHAELSKSALIERDRWNCQFAKTEQDNTVRYVPDTICKYSTRGRFTYVCIIFQRL